MGILKRLFRKQASTFEPNFSETEYDNWLNFLKAGGTSEQWELLKKEHTWEFRKRRVEIFEEYQSISKPIWDRYYFLLHEIQEDWSCLYNSGNYSGTLAESIEGKCIESIQLYKQMKLIDEKYGEKTPENVPAFTRLAMLYEKQEEFEKSVLVCMNACNLGIDEHKRMLRIIKKSNRIPTPEESVIIDEFENRAKPIKAGSQKSNNGNTIDRTVIPAEKIDAMQRIEASKAYRKKIYGKYYKNYPELPFISQDREFNTNWIEQAEMFPQQSIIPKSMMVRYSDGLLPGHVYMLYWIKEIHRKRIPVYFEYRYGINFYKEKIFLTENGYLKDDKLTEKGEKAISKHYIIIEKHHPSKNRVPFGQN